jgi:hypothetical protein
VAENFFIVIDVPGRTLFLYQKGKLMSQYPVAVGKLSTPTPRGAFTIIEKYMHPGGAFGTRWLGLSKLYYGIHGTNAPALIGQAVSNGCIRMYNHDVEILYDYVEIGTIVRIPDNQKQTPGKENQFYTVQQGDNLWSIALYFHTTADVLIRLNKLPNPDLIYPGQQLLLP